MTKKRNLKENPLSNGEVSHTSRLSEELNNPNDPIAILVIHGIGIHHDEEEEKEYAQKTREAQEISIAQEIRNEIEAKILRPLEEKVKLKLPQGYEGLKRELTRIYQAKGGTRRLVFVPVKWGKVLQPHEDALWEQLVESGLKPTFVRRLIVMLLADILAYQPIEAEDSVYQNVQQTIRNALHDLGTQVFPTTPLYIVAHSLGSVIAADFIATLQRQPPEKGTPLEKGETLQGLYTLGSPLALYSLRENAVSHLPGMTQAVKDNLTHFPVALPLWRNFYSSKDLVSYPLTFLAQDKPQLNLHDHSIAVGNLLTSWNAASHVMYWTDLDVLNPIVEDLLKI